MEVIRLQNKAPSVYTEESRDFQLFCRLFDCVLNGVKFDIDSMKFLTDSSRCKTNILQLLQTKLGFFTERKMNDEALRYILRAFPTILKGKGSLRAIEQAVNVFLKIYNINTTISVWYVQDSTMVYNTMVDDHTIIIGMNTAMNDISILEEVFRYILPTGFGFYFYFYNTMSEAGKYLTEDKAILLFTSDNIASEVRGNFKVTVNGTTYTYNDPILAIDSENRLVGAVNTLMLASYESAIPTVASANISDFSESTNYKVGDLVNVNDQVYKLLTTLQVFSKSKSYQINDFVYHNRVNYVCTSNTTPGEFDIEKFREIKAFKPKGLYNVGDYIFYDYKVWQCVEDITEFGEWDPNKWESKTTGLTKGRWIDESSKWEFIDTYESSYKNKFRGVFTNANEVSNPEEEDVILVHDSSANPRVDQAKIRIGSVWKNLNFLGLRDRLPQDSSAYDVVGIVTKEAYYRYINDQWQLLNYRGYYNSVEEVVLPQVNDLIKTTGQDNKTQYWVYLESGMLEYEWRQLNYKSMRHEFPERAQEDDLVVIDGVTYYIYRNGRWNEDTKTIFMLRHIDAKIEGEE